MHSGQVVQDLNQKSKDLSASLSSIASEQAAPLSIVDVLLKCKHEGLQHLRNSGVSSVFMCLFEAGHYSHFHNL